MADSNSLLKERVEILNKIKQIQLEQGKDAAKLDETYIKLKSRLEGIVGTLKTFVENQNKTIQGAVTLEQDAKSLGTIYSAVSNEMRTQAVLQKDIASNVADQLARGSQISERNKTSSDIVTGILSQYNEQSSIAKELAQLTADDIVQKAELEDKLSSISDQIQEQVNALDKRTNVAKEFLSLQGQIEASIESQVVAARDMASLTQEQKDILEDQAAAFDTIKKKIGALGSTLTTFLKRPQAAIGALVIATGAFANKFGDVNNELGQSFLQGMNKSTASATALGFVFEDTAGTVKALSSEFGDVSAATFQTQANVGLIASNMGITNTEAVGLMGSFARLNDGSTSVAADMIKTTQEFANQNGIIPSELMADLAGSAEEFALFGKDGGKNILQAAGYAKKLGVNMSTISGMADNLLDFESSITKELELGAMLGKDINLDRARALAYAGDLEGATKETLDALGGQAAFAEMDYFQRKASADLLGVSVAELEKMVSNQANANTLGAAVNEKFSMMGETLNMGLNKYLGTGLEGLGGMITMSGQLGTGFSAISDGAKNLGINIGGAVKGTAQVLKNVLGMVAGPVLNGIKAIGGGLMDSFGGTKLGESIGGIKDKLMSKGAGLKDKLMAGVGDKAKEAAVPEVGGGDKAAGSADKLSKINGMALIQAAAAMLIMAAALYVMAKGLQEFNTVDPTSLLKAAGALIILGGALYGLSVLLAPLAASGILYMVAAGMLAMGAAVFLVGAGIKLFAEGVATLGSALPNMVQPLMELSQINFLPILGLAASLGVLGFALMGFGLASLMAAPGLLLVGGGIMMIGTGLTLISTSLATLGGGLTSVITAMSTVGSVIGELFQYIAPIAALSLALVGLAGALTLVSVAGIAALPGLMAVAAVGAIAVGVGSMLGMGGEGEGKKDDSTQLLIDEMKGLRADLNAGKISVNMDGTKVTSAVSRVVSKVGSNSYAI